MKRNSGLQLKLLNKLFGGVDLKLPLFYISGSRNDLIFVFWIIIRIVCPENKSPF